ncbi:hypothetical protein H4219_005820 [Mycoemilia scoparia]|uniref:Uncharacterized protein n=1 Tax=Mycoemilia scoparia TaxID=417184 RepID=A0A9W7ZMV0_9FUNG|nr:hypothetical protein H4219_005820 [Mycoemilia scoparia]
MKTTSLVFLITFSLVASALPFDHANANDDSGSNIGEIVAFVNKYSHGIHNHGFNRRSDEFNFDNIGADFAQDDSQDGNGSNGGDDNGKSNGQSGNENGEDQYEKRHGELKYDLHGDFDGEHHDASKGKYEKDHHKVTTVKDTEKAHEDGHSHGKEDAKWHGKIQGDGKYYHEKRSKELKYDLDGQFGGEYHDASKGEYEKDHHKVTTVKDTEKAHEDGHSHGKEDAKWHGKIQGDGKYHH